MEKHNMLGLCTSHLDNKARDLVMADEIYGVTIYDKSDYGWFIPVPENLEIEEIKDSCPSSLYECLKFAAKNGFDWIMYDCAVEPISDLPTYEW